MPQAFWAAPAPPPAPPANPWPGVQMTWTGTDGTVWDLCADESGVHLMPGVRGLTTPPRTRFTSQSATVAGSRSRGGRTLEREVFWPLSIWEESGSQAWLEYDRAFWSSLNPRGEGIWRVTQPDGSWRELRCRPTGDDGKAWDLSPGMQGWTKYGIYLIAEDPFWYGPAITSPLWTSGGAVDFIPAVTATYAWTGTPGQSSSTKSVDGVVVAENLCTNPSVEVDDQGWGAYAPPQATAGRSSGAAWVGSHSFRVEMIAASVNLGTQLSAFDTISSGETVAISVKIRPEATNSDTTTQATFILRDNEAGVNYAQESVALAPLTDGWVQASLTHTVPAGSTLSRIYMRIDPENGSAWAVGDAAHFDAAMISTSPGPYFDGDTPDEGGGPPYYPSSATTIESASLTNPGDEDAWPVWTATGPVDSVSVSVDGSEVAFGALTEGQVLVIDTDPRVQTATLDGVDVTGDLTAWDFAPIPAGETVPLSIEMVGDGTLQASIRPRHDRAW